MSYDIINDRIAHYNGYVGSAKKEAIYSLSADRLEQQFYPFDHEWLMRGKPGATDILSQRQLTGAKARDFALDLKNPKQELPKSRLDVKHVEEIPQWDPQQIDISTPMDMEAHDQVNLLQSSNLNAMKQENLFIDPDLVGDSKYNTDKVGTKLQGIPQTELYNFEGSAAGRISNYFNDDGGRLNSIESTVAF